jgi:hypothetical protein
MASSARTTSSPGPAARGTLGAPVFSNGTSLLSLLTAGGRGRHARDSLLSHPRRKTDRAAWCRPRRSSDRFTVRCLVVPRPAPRILLPRITALRAFARRRPISPPGDRRPRA